MARKKLKNTKNKIGSRKIDSNIKLISILFWIFGIFLILQGVILFGAYLGLFNWINLEELVNQPIANVMISCVLVILLGIFTIFVAKGIFKLKNWARLAGIFLSILSIVNSIFSLSLNVIAIISFLILIVIRLWIIQYLIKNKEMFR